MNPTPLLAAVLLLAGCGSATPAPSAPAATSSAAADTFTLNGQVVLTGRFTTNGSTEQGAPCFGTSSSSDLVVGAQVVVSVDGSTVALGSITESLTDFATKPGVCALRVVVDDVPGGRGFYSVKVGQHDAPQLSEADARELVTLRF